MTSAPHLAGLTRATVTPDGAAEFVRTTARGFHEDDDPVQLAAALALLEHDRFFGFRADGRWVSTCGSWGRRLGVPGGTVAAAAVSYVTVTPSFRRRGLLRSMMQHQLADIAARGEPVAVLWASEAPIYGRFGYGAAVAGLSLSGPTRTTAFRPDVDLGAGSVGEVDAARFRTVVPALRERLLADRPGRLDRSDAWWTRELLDLPATRGGATARRYALHFDADGTPDGFVGFAVARTPMTPGETRVWQLDGATPAAVARLWRFVLDLDLIGTFRADSPVDGPLLHLLEDPRAVTAGVSDATYVRLVDVPAALAARRYAAPLDLVIGVRDTMLTANAGSVRVRVEADGSARTERTDAVPDVELDVRELGALYLGGPSASTLHRAGLLTEHTDGAVRAMAAAFGWHRHPYCDDHF